MIRRFEDLIAWQKARVLTREIYRVTRQGTFSRDFGLAGQIQRAAVSTMSNIAEGFERNRLTEFHQFLSAAKSSCAEVRSQLYVALDVEYLTPAVFQRLMTIAEEVGRITGGLRASVQAKKKRKTATRAQQRDSSLTQDSGLSTQDSGLSTQDSGLSTQDSDSAPRTPSSSHRMVQ